MNIFNETGEVSVPPLQVNVSKSLMLEEIHRHYKRDPYGLSADCLKLSNIINVLYYIMCLHVWLSYKVSLLIFLVICS